MNLIYTILSTLKEQVYEKLVLKIVNDTETILERKEERGTTQYPADADG